MLLSAEDFVKAMGWDMSVIPSEKVNIQRSLFLELSDEEQKIVTILEKRGNLQINSLVVEADIPVHKINAILFELEMKGVVRVLAGGCINYWLSPYIGIKRSNALLQPLLTLNLIL